jgi:deoxyribodipyrimidine photolyase-related protein
VLGWREFVHHVHVATDGFRTLRGVPVPTAAAPGDGGYGTWKGSAWPSHKGADGGAQPQALEAGVPLPPAFWGVKSGLNCLDHVVGEVWDHGYSHHITRLMVLSNIGTLLGVSPRELTDWFWVAYTDAYDWVVEPNVLGMGTFATGDVMTTKPYVSGAGYVSRMGDYCGDCAWNPKKNCPLTPMYWHFLTRNAASLGRNPRMMVPVKAAAKRTPEQKAEDARVHGSVVDALSRGRAYQP